MSNEFTNGAIERENRAGKIYSSWAKHREHSIASNIQHKSF